MAEIRGRFVEILNARVPLRGLSVFEPGCGDGVFTVELLKVTDKVYSSDARQEQCDAANRRIAEECGPPSTIAPRFEVSRRDVESDLPAGGIVDVVFHVGLLYHLNDPVNHLTKICAIARKAVFLDTHYVHGVDPVPRHEDVKMLREGIRPRSLWLPLTMIVDTMKYAGFHVDVIDLRTEPNGPRATLLAIRRGM